jgi:hypothetical protein
LWDGLIATERVRAIQEELAGFLLEQGIAPDGEHYVADIQYQI